MIQSFILIHRFSSHLDSQPFELLDIYAGQHGGGVGLAALQLRKLLQGFLRIRVGSRAGGKGDQHLVCVQARIFAAQIFSLQLLNRFDGGRGEPDGAGDGTDRQTRGCDSGG